MLTIKAFYDQSTATFSYVVSNAEKDAVIIDPVLDYDPQNAAISYGSINQVVDYVAKNQLRPHLVLDTHAHADHLSGAFFLKERLKIKSAIGEGFIKVQNYFAPIFGLDTKESYDYFIADEQVIEAGQLRIRALKVPGHTPSCMAYLIEDALFIGDVLFQPEVGAGRADFPGGSASELFNSIKKRVYSLPDSTRVFVGHDYPKGEDEARSMTSVLASKQQNILIKEHTGAEPFINERKERDAKLPLPRLFFAAMQVNILGGRLPPADMKGRCYLKIPLSVDLG